VPLSREAVIEQSAALGVSGCAWLADFDENDIQARISERRIGAGSELLEEFSAEARRA